MVGAQSHRECQSRILYPPITIHVLSNAVHSQTTAHYFVLAADTLYFSFYSELQNDAMSVNALVDATGLPIDVWVEILNSKDDTPTPDNERYSLDFVAMLNLASTCRPLRNVVLGQHTYWRDQSLQFPRSRHWGQLDVDCTKYHVTSPMDVYFRAYSTLMDAISLDQRAWITENPPGSKMYTDAVGGDCGLVLGPIYPWRIDFSRNAATSLNAWFRANYVKAQYTLEDDDGSRGGTVSGFIIASCAQRFNGSRVWHDIFTFCGRAASGYVRTQINHNRVLGHVLDRIWIGIRDEFESTNTYIERYPDDPSIKAFKDRPMTRLEQFQKAILFHARADAVGTDWDSEDAVACMTRCGNPACNKYFPYEAGRYTHYHVGCIGNLSEGPNQLLFCSYWCLVDTALFSQMCVPCDHCNALIPLSACLGLAPILRESLEADDEHSVPKTRRLDQFRHGYGLSRSYKIAHAVSNVGALWKVSQARRGNKVFDLANIRLASTPPPPPYSNSALSLMDWELRMCECSMPCDDNATYPDVNGIGHAQPCYTDGYPTVAFNYRTVRGCSQMVFDFYCSDACHRDETPTRCGNYDCRKPIRTEFAAASLECAAVLFVKANGERLHRGYVCDRVCGNRFISQLAERAHHKQRHNRKKRLQNSPDTPSPKKARFE